MKKNISELLMAVAAIDGLIHENEKRYLLEELNIDIEDSEHTNFLEDIFDNVKNKNFLNILINNITKKHEIEECVHHLTRLIAVDSIFHEKENKFLIFMK